jgi:hypothetical protein
MPANYQNQIQTSNFTALSGQVNALIIANVLPTVNTILTKGYQLPEIGTLILDDPDFLQLLCI